MSAFEKVMLSLTGVFLLFCAALLLSQTSAAAVTGEGCTVYAEADVGARTVSEKLNAVLGIQSDAPETEGRIDINSATEETLAALPGIGKTRAARIIRYRTYNGPFEDVSYLRDVTGIGDGLYAKIAHLIYAGN